MLFNGFSFFLLFFFITFNFLGVLLEVEFFVISRILILLLFFYLLQIPCRYPGSCVLYHFSDAQSLSCFALSPSCSLAFSWKLRSLSFLGCSIFLLFFLSTSCSLRSPGSCVFCHFSDSHTFSCFSLSPSCSYAFSCNLRFMSLSAFSFALLFFFISFIFVGVFLEVAFLVISRIFFFYLLFFFISIMFLSVLLEVAFYVIFRILIRSPVFLYLLHVPWRFPGICVLCPFSVSQSLSSFYLSPTCSLAFSWKLRSLSFLGCAIFLLFFYLLHVPCVLLEVAFFVIFRILKLSPVFLYLLHVHMRSPVICVLCHRPHSHSLSCFSLSPSYSLAFFWKLRFWLFLGFFFLPPVFLYLHHVPKRSPGSCVLCHFSDSHSLSCFSLSASCSLAFSWNLRSLSFLGFPVALQLVFIYLPHVHWHSPGSWVLFLSDSHFLSYFSLYPFCSLGFF